MKTLKIVLRLILNLFLFILYFLSGFVPRNSKIVVYGCPRNGFSDNAKYAFLYNSLSPKKQSEHYWVSSNRQLINEIQGRGLNAVYRWSWRGSWITLRAGVHIYSSYASDINFWLSRNAHLINYWHGIPLKKIEFDIKRGPLAKRYNPKNVSEKIASIIYYIYHPAIFKRPHALCNPLPKFNQIFMRAFRVSERELFQDLYPRWRYIKGDNTVEELLNNKLDNLSALGQDRKLILYLPTFRDSDGTWVKKHLLDHLSDLEIILGENRFILLVKLHPNEAIKPLKSYKNIHFVESSVDIYPLLKHATVVLTDYSSVMIDTAVCGKEVVLYWPDFAEYTADSRDSYFNLRAIFGDKPLRTAAELKSFLSGSIVDRVVNKEISEEFIGINSHDAQ